VERGLVEMKASLFVIIVTAFTEIISRGPAMTACGSLDPRYQRHLHRNLEIQISLTATDGHVIIVLSCQEKNWLSPCHHCYIILCQVKSSQYQFIPHIWKTQVFLHRAYGKAVDKHAGDCEFQSHHALHKKCHKTLDACGWQYEQVRSVSQSAKLYSTMPNQIKSTLLSNRKFKCGGIKQTCVKNKTSHLWYLGVFSSSGPRSVLFG
jgi:hypothetical protein